MSSLDGHRRNALLVYEYIVCGLRSHLFFFFFQAEDGIRVLIVTGVQTCALPIPPQFGWPPPARASSPHWAFNQALRQLGVPRGAAFDEFEAVGLGRHRHTEDWLAHRA